MTAFHELEEIAGWQDISFLPGFQVTPDGVVRETETGRVVEPELGKDQRLYVHLRVPVDALVAFTFNPVPEHLDRAQVVHVDGVLSNNHFSNLSYQEAK